MTLSKDLKARVVDTYSQGDVTMREVAEMFNVSLGFTHNVVAYHRRFGEFTNPDTPGPRGRRRVLDTINMLFIREIVEAEPSIYLDELQYKLAIARNVRVSIATISPTLSRMGFTWKAVSLKPESRRPSCWRIGGSSLEGGARRGKNGGQPW